MSRNKTEGTYKGWRYGRHFRSVLSMSHHIGLHYGNPLYSTMPRSQIK